jgi:beta-xylosidase
MHILYFYKKYYMNCSIALLFLFACTLNIQSGRTAGNHAIEKPSFNNKFYDTSIVWPVIPGDLADPTIIRIGNAYYASGTSSEWAPQYPLFKSNDLIHWKQLGYIFPQTPSWASSSFWAPELFYRNGIYYIYYTARKKSDNISRIGVATTKDPGKGFTDHGIVLEFDKEAIDPFIIEDKGKLYITFKAYGLNDRPIELLGYQLSDDGFKTEGEPFMLLRDDERIGLEGQCIIKRNNYYYLFYSAGNCCGRTCSYHVNVARAISLKGPYVKHDNNPVLSEYNSWKCTGHGTIVNTPQGEDFYLYHAYSKNNDVYTGRQAMLAKLKWNKETGWPAVNPVSGEEPTGLHDDFSVNKINDYWQWDFRHTEPIIKTGKGLLHLSGRTTSNNITGTALTIRPYTSNYEISTAVMNSNASFKGLTVYGDANQATGIGVKNDMIQVWMVKDTMRKVLKELQVNPSAPLYLKIKVEDGYKLRFYWSNVFNSWNELTTGNDYFNADFLPPWDRSPRPGLLQLGVEPAVFDFFEIRYE